MEKITDSMQAKKEIAALIAEGMKYAFEMEVEDVEKKLGLPPKVGMGDFAFPCFEYAKILKKSPAVIAQILKDIVEQNGEKVGNIVEKAETAGGYLNLFLNRKEYAAGVTEAAGQYSYGSLTDGCGKSICMDYSSPNIAKNFHVGHLRTTIIGNSLAKIFVKNGYQVVRMNHLGDWGTQFGKLITAYKLWSSREMVEQGGIDELLRIYVKFDTEAEQQPELDNLAREWFSKMEHGNEDALAIWKWFKEISLKEFELVYKLLGVEFDSWNGESFYVDQVPELAEELKEKGLLTESEGAEIVSLDAYDMPPCLIRKKDGSTIYHSRDLAAAKYRKKTYDFAQCLYITGMEQKLHFAQIFQTLKLMGYDWADTCHHIPYGLVSMAGAKLSTRKGNVIYAEDILQEAIARAEAAIEEKNPQLEQKKETAKQIGVGAVIFHDLSNQLIRNVNFNWEEVLNFDGMTAPYIQYTHARACSILRKHQAELTERAVDIGVYLTDEVSYSLVGQIGRYKEAVREAAETYEPCVIARYAYRLAVLYNQFYQTHRVADAKQEVKQARLALTAAVCNVIKDAMGLMGIECPEKM